MRHAVPDEPRSSELLALAISDWLMLVDIKLLRAALAKPPLAETIPSTRHKLALESYIRPIDPPGASKISALVPVLMRLAAVELALLSDRVAEVLPALTIVRI